MKRLAALALAALALPHAAPAQPGGEDTCLLFVAKNISNGNGNLYIYYVFSEKPLKIEAGDVLEYDVFLYPQQPAPLGGIEINFADGANLRDSGAKDQNGIGSHGGNALPQAVGQWHRREIDLGGRAGLTTRTWDFVCEGDAPGLYIQFIDNVAVRRADGTRVAIYDNGPPPANRMDWKEGYSQSAVLRPVPRARVATGTALDGIIEGEVREELIDQLARDFAADLDRLKDVLAMSGEARAVPQVDAARQAMPAPKGFAGSVGDFRARLDAARRLLPDIGPILRKYTGHLVGHAHIDLEWLWEWCETVEINRDTFGQQVKFMEEMPDFTYTQSSACLYKLTEEHLPELFEKIRAFVKKGQWEIVGGRWCEGDTHMPSGESHARHFLYGQRYFREKFGTDAKVGWEPDTFGHMAQMPQLLRLAGIDSYYFCRGGAIDRKKPLYHWEGLDGSRVLAFEETATGSWYNAEVGPKQIEELLDFRKLTGSFDTLWVYGTGNHGGGPTREYIATAREWQKDPLKPQAKFSTVTAWFRALRAQKEMKEVPVVQGELNHERPGVNEFWGCYTTHADMKRRNRDAEALTVQAETLAAVASRFGFPYPKATFVRSWQDILWNHHHDSLSGTSIHPSYFLSRQVYDRAIGAARRTIQDTAELLAARVRPSETQAALVRPRGPGRAVIAFNTLGWRRDALVEVEADASFYPPRAVNSVVAVGPSGEVLPVQQSGDRRYLFVAKDLPACGYRVYVLRPRAENEPGIKGVSVAPDGRRLVGGRFELEIDPAQGLVTRLIDKKLGRDWIVPEAPGNRLVSYLEEPHGMSAWTIGKFVAHEEPQAARTILPTPDRKAWEEGPVRAGVRLERRYRNSTIVQDIQVYRDLDRVDFALDIDWHERGGGGKPAPFLKVEFTPNVKDSQPRYEIPFGDIARPAHGREVPALQWADLSGGEGGLALLNDCKYGHASDNGTMRLSLIRCSYEPDPEPDLGHHEIRYAIVPHAGSVHESGVTKQGFEFNHKTIAFWMDGVAPAPGAPWPAEKSFLDVGGEGVIPTALKLAEDGNDWVVRFYQSSGKPATAKLACAFDLEGGEAVNLVEDTLSEAVKPDAIPLRPYEVKTVRLRLRDLQTKK